ncbi:MAG: hypothetical protein RIG77_12435 [Cyclobacteriaceae bacterium]
MSTFKGKADVPKTTDNEKGKIVILQPQQKTKPPLRSCLIRNVGGAKFGIENSNIVLSPNDSAVFVGTEIILESKDDSSAGTAEFEIEINTNY